MLSERLLSYIPLVLSLSVHEWAHAWTALQLGDDTAERQGRVTLNPIVHMDPIGTVLLPLLGMPIGWAKPVPFNPVRFRVNMELGALLVALAGPVSNLVLALLCAGALHLYIGYMGSDLTGAIPAFLTMMIILNVLLAAFNLIPIPPLDGSHIINPFVPSRLRPAWDTVRGNGVWALLILVVILPMAGIDVLKPLFSHASSLARALIPAG